MAYFNVSRDWFGIYVSEEDFGQTFAHWGISPGPHIEIPFLGQFNIRDAFGFVLDSLVSPRSWIISFLLLPDVFLLSTGTNLSIFMYKVINRVSLRRGEYEELKKKCN